MAQECTEAWTNSIAPDGTNGFVYSVYSATIAGQTHAYITGSYTTLNDEPIARLARWDGAAWSAIGSGMDKIGFAITAFDEGMGDRLFVGGSFTGAGATATRFIARWDGSAWSTVGGGLTGTGAVRALTTHDDGTGESLYIGGQFTGAGGVAVKNIACWDGAQYHALGPGLNGPVLALASYDDGTGPALYAGGDFTATGDHATALNRIAKWDGSSWSPVGAGFDNSVNALVSGVVGGESSLFAGGAFLNSGATPFSRLARWDGAGWTSVSTGANWTVHALTMVVDSLFVGGEFHAAGGVPARLIAKWDGTTFSALGVGMTGGSGQVRSLAHTTLADGGLIVGGSFAKADNISAENVALWLICETAGPDLNGDDSVDGADLAALLAAWGQSGTPADLNGDSVVDGEDLAALLASWTG